MTSILKIHSFDNIMCAWHRGLFLRVIHPYMLIFADFLYLAVIKFYIQEYWRLREHWTPDKPQLLTSIHQCPILSKSLKLAGRIKNSSDWSQSLCKPPSFSFTIMNLHNLKLLYLWLRQGIFHQMYTYIYESLALLIHTSFILPCMSCLVSTLSRIVYLQFQANMTWIMSLFVNLFIYLQFYSLSLSSKRRKCTGIHTYFLSCNYTPRKT